MKTMIKLLGVCASLVLPFAASAQSSDEKYCAALANKYTQYVSVSEQQRRGRMLDASASTAIAKCKAGDTATGIPVLEKALTDAKVELPARN